MRTIASSLLVAAVLLFGFACDKGVSVSKIEPNTGNVVGGDFVTIYGTGLKPGVTVHFGKRECQIVVIEAGKRMRVKTPSGPRGPIDVVVTDENGKTFLIKNGFTYISQLGR